jgi:hypothetical protein
MSIDSNSWGAAATADWAGPELAALQQELAPPDDDGRSRVRSGIGGHADPPYDLQSPEPRAVDLLTLWKRVGKAPDPELLASLGPNRPILLSHGITAFHKMGRRPRAIWGMGYQATVTHGDARTLDVTPRSEHLTVGSLEQNIRLGITLDGRIEVPAMARAAIDAIPGVGLNGASIELGADERLAFTIRYEFRVLKVQAGPLAPGGARWNLYRQDQPLDDFHPLLQTLLVPRSARTLDVEVQAWAREAGFLGPGREWTFEPRSYRVSLARGS